MRHKTQSGHYIGQLFPTQRELTLNYTKLIRKINGSTSRLTPKQKHAAILKLPGITREQMDLIIHSTGPKLAITLREFISKKRLAKLDKRNIVCALKIRHGKIVHIHGSATCIKIDKKIITYAVINGTLDVNVKGFLKNVINLAMSSIKAHTGLKFVRVSISNNPFLVIQFQNNPNGDLYLKKKPNVLAYFLRSRTTKPNMIVFNDYNREWGLKDRYQNGIHIYNIQHVMSHELGHFLKLPHNKPIIKNGTMNPMYNGKNMKFAPSEVKLLVKYHGKRTYRHPQSYLRLKKAILHRKSHLRR